MKINADLAARAVVASDGLPWVPSPSPGVERRLLERHGDEVARLTSLVRYAPGSQFSAHTHGGGEEFLVLEGTFSDDYGDFPAGTYVRNPVGSSHRPHTEPGCLILVKLCWMQPEDQEFVRVDTTLEDLWQATGWPGIEVLPLHAFERETNALYRLEPGAVLPARALPGGEELFVLAGACHDVNGRYAKGVWLRHPIGPAPKLTSDMGCKLYLKRGHLAKPPPVPAAVEDRQPRSSIR